MIFSGSYLKAADTFTDARMCQAFRKIFMLFCILYQTSYDKFIRYENVASGSIATVLNFD